MREATKFLAGFWSDQGGVSSVEYALLLAFIAAGVAVAADQLGVAFETGIDGAASCGEQAAPAGDCQ